MIAYIMLFVFISMAILLAYYFLPFSMFLFGMIGSLFTIFGYFAVFHIMYPKMFPVKVRGYGDRLDSFTVTEDGRARVTNLDIPSSFIIGFPKSRNCGGLDV